ncbi:MAG: hypothetical protein ACXACA_08100 [Candidatus Ranarchaeia archaeon]
MDDEGILRQVDSLPRGQLLFYSRCYTVKNLKHYVGIQYEWFVKATYYAGLTLQRSPSQLELVEHWNLHSNAERFRVFYVLKYPENVELLEPEWHI